MKGSDKGKPMVAAPGELYSTAQGAPVASTEQIYDYLKEKSQETINTEVQQKLNELEANQGGNDGLSEQQVQNKIDNSLQNLNTENSGDLGDAVAKLIDTVGNKPNNKNDHETRITALESANPTDYSERLNTIESNISDLGTGLSDANTSIQTEETRAKGAETRLEGLINNLDEDIEDLNDELNNINSNILLQFKEKRTGTISDTSRFHAETIGCNPTAVFYYEQYKRFVVERNDQIFGYWGCGNAYNNYSSNGEGATPFKNRIYVDQNKLVYTWDGVTLRALGLQFENSSDDSGSQEDPKEPVTIPEITYGNLNTATEYSYYTVTETTSGVKYKIGVLQVVNSPEGTIQILTTPKNLEEGTYELGKVHTYIRVKRENNWSEWQEKTDITTNEVYDNPRELTQEKLNDSLSEYFNFQDSEFYKRKIDGESLMASSVKMNTLGTDVKDSINSLNSSITFLSNKITSIISDIEDLKLNQKNSTFNFENTIFDGFFIVDNNDNVGACIIPGKTYFVTCSEDGETNYADGTLSFNRGENTSSIEILTSSDESLVGQHFTIRFTTIVPGELYEVYDENNENLISDFMIKIFINESISWGFDGNHNNVPSLTAYQGGTKLVIKDADYSEYGLSLGNNEYLELRSLTWTSNVSVINKIIFNIIPEPNTFSGDLNYSVQVGQTYLDINNSQYSYDASEKKYQIIYDILPEAMDKNVAVKLECSSKDYPNIKCFPQAYITYTPVLKGVDLSIINVNNVEGLASEVSGTSFQMKALPVDRNVPLLEGRCYNWRIKSGNEYISINTSELSEEAAKHSNPITFNIISNGTVTVECDIVGGDGTTKTGSKTFNVRRTVTNLDDIAIVPVDLSNVDLNNNTITANTVQLAVAAIPEGAEIKEVSWFVDEGPAIIDEKGFLTKNMTGEDSSHNAIVVRATAKSGDDEIKSTSETFDSGTYDPNSWSIYIKTNAAGGIIAGTGFQCYVSVSPGILPGEEYRKRVAWEISNGSEFASIDDNGKVTIKKNADASFITVTAKSIYNSAQYSLSFIVTYVPDGDINSIKIAAITNGAQIQFKAIGSYSNGNVRILDNSEVNWEFADDPYFPNDSEEETTSSSSGNNNTGNNYSNVVINSARNLGFGSDTSLLIPHLPLYATSTTSGVTLDDEAGIVTLRTDKGHDPQGITMKVSLKDKPAVYHKKYFEFNYYADKHAVSRIELKSQTLIDNFNQRAGYPYISVPFEGYNINLKNYITYYDENDQVCSIDNLAFKFADNWSLGGGSVIFKAFTNEYCSLTNSGILSIKKGADDSQIQNIEYGFWYPGESDNSGVGPIQYDCMTVSVAPQPCQILVARSNTPSVPVSIDLPNVRSKYSTDTAGTTPDGGQISCIATSADGNKFFAPNVIYSTHNVMYNSNGEELLDNNGNPRYSTSGSNKCTIGSNGIMFINGTGKIAIKARLKDYSDVPFVVKYTTVEVKK